MKKRIMTILSFFLVFMYLMILPYTYGKFEHIIYGIAWENYFTPFSQLKSIFYIKDTSTSANGLWGGVNADFDQNTGLGDSGNNRIIYHDEVGDFYTFGELSEGGIFGWGRNDQISLSNLKKYYNDYLLEKLKNIELNVVNNSTQDMVIIFKIYYYAPVPSVSNDQEQSPSISFEVYNTIENPDGINETINNQTYYRGLKGEFLSNLGSEDFTDGQYADLIEVPSDRTSGGSQGQIRVDGVWYRAHRAVINPYKILYNPQTNIKYPLTYVSSQAGGKVIKYTSEDINGNTTIDTQDDNTVVAFQYPAYDNSQTTKKSATQIMGNTDINDYILTVGEAASFNLTLFYGNLSNEENSTGTFVAALGMEAVPYSQCISEMKQVVNG